MKRFKKVNLVKYILLLSSLLIINVILGVLLGIQSGSSLKEQINSRMLDISKTAASMIDGDVLRDIGKDDKGTPKYEEIMRILNYFREHTDLQYIYCVKKNEDGDFVFTLDTDPDDPGEYGSPVEYTDALNKANEGTPSADDDFYEDRWGSFYSAYCPVFDSSGNVGGIIVVDYNKDWYDKQMAAQIRTTVIVIASSFIIGTVIILIMSGIAAKRRKMNEYLSNQLSSAADIYIAMYDLNLIQGTFNEVRNHDTELSEMIAGSSMDCQEVMNRLMEALAGASAHDKMLAFVDLSGLDKRLKKHSTLTEEFISSEGKWCKARFIVSAQLSDGTVSEALFLVEDIDEEKRCRDMIFGTAQQLSYELSSIAAMYTAVYDIDIMNDSLIEICSKYDVVGDSVGSEVHNAQKVLHDAVIKLTNERYRENVLGFTKLSNIEGIIDENGTASIEFLTSEDKWCRGRLIVSERTYEGAVSHVLWTVENIDTERKERDMLRDISQRAITSNEAKSFFISNMSREIRTPVNAVLGLNDMILGESSENSIIEYSEGIKKESMALLELVNDIFDFSQLEEGKTEINSMDYDLSAMVSDLVRVTAKVSAEKGLSLILDINSTIPKKLRGDEIHIKQVMTNILSNAVKYTNKGEITFSLQYRKIGGEPDNIMLIASVRDTGVGIRSDDLSKLLSDNSKMGDKRISRVSGSGLGLSITRHLLEMMGSSLEAESTYGVGSVFSFSLKQQVTAWEAIGDFENTAEPPKPENEVPPKKTAVQDAPAEKAKVRTLPKDNTVIPEVIYSITEINTYSGIISCGGREEFVKTIYSLAETINGYINDIQKCYNTNDIPGTAAKINGFVPVLRSSGAAILGDMAQRLEEAAERRDIMKLEKELTHFLDRCRYLSEQLRPLRTKGK